MHTIFSSVDEKGVDSGKSAKQPSERSCISYSPPSQMLVELGFYKLYLSLKNLWIPSPGKPEYIALAAPLTQQRATGQYLNNVCTELWRLEISLSL